MPVLDEIHPHPKDALLTFEDEGHRYTYVPLECAIRKSMTGLLKPRFDTFDGGAIVKRRFAGWLADDENKYGPLTQYLMLVRGLEREDAEKEVLKLWSTKGDIAATAGTKMHRELELYWNDQLPVPTPSTPPPFGVVAFLGLLDWFNTDMELKAWRTEMLIVLTATDDEGIEFPVVAGSIDLVMVDKHGNFWLFDYKRTTPKKGLLGKRKAEASKFFRTEMAKPPFEDHPADDYTKYSCQILGYKYILEHGGYDLPVVACNMVQLHPDLNGKAHVMQAADLSEEVDAMMKLEIEIALRERRLAKLEDAGIEPSAEQLAPASIPWKGGYLIDADF